MTQQTEEESPIRALLGDVAPRLADLTEEVVVDQLWEHEGGISKRDRSFMTVATLTALYRTEQLRAHIGMALENGVTREEIGEIITHMAAYAGWPCAVNAAIVASEVYAELDG